MPAALALGDAVPVSHPYIGAPTILARRGAARLLKLLAARTASVLNVADLARDAGLKWETVNEYLSLLETAFLAHRTPAWSTNLTRRMRQLARGGRI